MRLIIMLLVLSGCSTELERSRSFSLSDDGGAPDMTVAVLGMQCRPNLVVPPCGPGLQCSPDCDVGLTCTVDGQCLPPCGNGNVSCTGGTVCTEGHDCIPPCLNSAGPIYENVPGSCEGSGLITTDDRRCVVPCWFFVCSLLGGHC